MEEQTRIAHRAFQHAKTNITSKLTMAMFRNSLHNGFLVTARSLLQMYEELPYQWKSESARAVIVVSFGNDDASVGCHCRDARVTKMCDPLVLHVRDVPSSGETNLLSRISTYDETTTYKLRTLDSTLE